MFRLKKYQASSIALVLLGFACPVKPALAQKKLNKPATAKVDSALMTLPVIENLNIGYTLVKKQNLTSAISEIPDHKINQIANVSPDALLQGQAAGVHVVNTSGAPGSGALIHIRGANTFNAGSMPLYIVDGIPVKAYRFSNPVTRNADNNPLADINPLDIASIKVLKDAQATSIYGMRGANGVILIDTYPGTNGKTLLDFSGYTGVMQAPKALSVFDADAYRNYTLEKEQARGLTSQQINNGIGKYLLLSTPASQVERYNNNSNWQNETLRGGLYNDYHLNLRGGDAVAKYSLNAGYTTQGGVIDNSNFNRFSTRFNLDYKVGRKLSFLNSLAYSKTDRKLQDEGDATATNPLYLATLKSPVLTSFRQDTEGVDLREPDSADFAGRNNLYSVINRMRNESSTNRIFGKIIGQYTFSPYLNLRIGIAADFYRLNEKRFRPSAGFLPEGYIVRASSEKNSTELMMLNENILSYNRNSRSGSHSFSAFIGNAFQTTSQESKFGLSVNSTSDEFGSINASDQRFIDSVGSFSPSWKLMSFFGNVQYAFKEKYLLGANLRADGSSRFAKGHRWGYFPSVSAGWRVSSEPFLKNSRVISELKVRTSYGITGNQEIGYYNSFNALVPADYSNYAGIRIGLLGNRSFTWEETKQFDAGIDLGFLKNKLLLTTDFYVRNTDNLYNTIRLPGISGLNSYAVSEGSVRNTGVELSLSGKIIAGKFSWQSILNAAYNKNQILSTPALMTAVTNYTGFSGIIQTGNSIGAFYGYNALGVYRNSEDVKVKNGADDINPFKGGDIIFEDADRNGVIDEGDRKVIGNSNPDFFGGFSNIFSFKNFDLNVFVDYAVGNEVFNAQRASLEAMSTYDNQAVSVTSRWRNEGDISDIPRALHGDAVGNTRFSSRWIEDGSFARLKTLTLGYNVPLNGQLKNVFKSARLLLTAQNLYTLSNYKGYSPEVGSATNAVMYGQDYGNLPQLKSFLLGVKLGL